MDRQFFVLDVRPGTSSIHDWIDLLTRLKQQDGSAHLAVGQRGTLILSSELSLQALHRICADGLFYPLPADQDVLRQHVSGDNNV